MPLTLYHIVLLSVEAIFYAFHISFLIVLFFDKSTKFHGAFYNIIRIIFVADLFYIFMMFFVRSPGFGLWPDFYRNNGWLAAIAFDSTAFLAFVQFFGQAFLAFNRFTSLWLPLRHKKIWSRQWYTIVILFIPFVAIIHRFSEPGIYLFTPAGDVIVRLVSEDAMQICYVVTAAVLYAMTSIGIVINTLAVIRFYLLKRANVIGGNKKDAHLLYVSCILFLIQCLRCAYNLARFLFSNNEAILLFLQLILPLIADIYAWIASFFIAIFESINSSSIFIFL